MRPCSNDVLNVSHPRGLIFLTCLRVGLSHLTEHKFKHSILDTFNYIFNCGFDIKTLNPFFIHCPRFTNKDKTFCLRLKGSSPTFREKPTLVLHQYFVMAIRDFQLNLTPTYSIHLLTIYYPQKGLNLLSLQRLDSYLRSSKF